jgi:hypothetical protein
VTDFIIALVAFAAVPGLRAFVLCLASQPEHRPDQIIGLDHCQLSKDFPRLIKLGGFPAALFVSSLHRLRWRLHHVMWLRHRVMVMVMIVVVMDDHHVRHVRLSRFLHWHFLSRSKGRHNKAERSDSC